MYQHYWITPCYYHIFHRSIALKDSLYAVSHSKKINLPNVFISLPMVTKIEKYFKSEMPYPIFLCNYTFLSGETKTYSLISFCLFGNQLRKTQQYDKEITKPQIQEMCNSMNIWTKENLSPNQVSLRTKILSKVS